MPFNEPYGRIKIDMDKETEKPETPQNISTTHGDSGEDQPISPANRQITEGKEK
jgi:hypothetical protein